LRRVLRKIFGLRGGSDRGLEETALSSWLVLLMAGRTGGTTGAYRAWWGNWLEKDHMEDLGVDWRILKWMLKKWDGGRHGLNWSGSGQWQVAGCCEDGNENPGSMQHREFLI
jgi:hypothetical protein